MKKYLLILFSFLILLEIGLRLVGIYDVYTEKLGSKYRSYWGFEHKGYYKILPKNQRITYESKEFNVDYTTNNFGMRNRELSLEPVDSTFRILCLGDSFTQGVGATNGNSFPRHLERLLNNEFGKQKVEVINGGSSGSDIIYSEKIFVDLLHLLKPQLVIISTNDSDIEDIIVRGGVERFKEGGYTKFKDGPWYEKYYERSHIVRLLTHVVFQRSMLFLTHKQEKTEIEKANNIIGESMLRIANFCLDNQIAIKFFVHSYPANYGFKKNRSAIKMNTQKYEIELQNQFQNRRFMYDINAFLFDTLQQLPYESYAWPLDGHFNDNGYKIIAEELFQHLKNEGVINQNL